MVQYDSKVIYVFADRLYKSASTIIWTHTLTAGVLGLLLGYMGAAALRNASVNPLVTAIILGLLLAALGYPFGVQKAFDLKLRAQIALCNVKVEENTRAGGGA